MKRQRGRGGRKSNGQANRHFESNGPDVKIRGSANIIFEKYQQLARDAASGGDHVRAENLLQHAEHYYRVMQANQPPQHRQNRDRQEGGEDAQPDIVANGQDAANTNTQDKPPLEVVQLDSDEQPSLDLSGGEPSGLIDQPQPNAGDEAGDGEKPARKPRRTRRPRKSAEAPTADVTEAREALEVVSAEVVEPIAQPN